MKIFNTLRNIEQDYPLLVSTGNDRQSRTAQNFFSKANKNLEASVSNLKSYLHHNTPSNSNQQIPIKTIKKSQLLMNTPPCNGVMNGRSYHIENTELLYKILRGDTKLVRSVMEANGFNYTESHEWNMLWASSSCKAYLYEGLNEH
jgi:hypothetical protein